ncbi:MAG: fibronectin type III domain-containing protein, partial [Elusimicrobia bacterium]|nr:fibronectin type III domain-containing protein [Elusimicrobiota bacterium]
IAQNTTYWGSEQSGIPAMNSEIQHLRLKENPVGDERILMAGIYAGTNDYEIWVTTWVDGNWAGTSLQLANALTTGAPGMDDCRGFDVAFEDQSGEGLICYSTGTADTIFYRIWDGSSFSTEYSTTGLPTSDKLTPYWIAMARRPGYDDIALIYLASDGTNHEIGALIWDGTNNKFSQQLYLGTAVDDTKECIGVVAMNESRNFMFVFSTSTTCQYVKWDGSNFGTIAKIGDFGDNVEFIDLACNTTDQIMLGLQDADDDVESAIYDGSNWTVLTRIIATARTISNHYVDVEWEDESDGNYCIMVYSDDADTDWAYWNGGTAWTATSGLYADESNRVELSKQPDGNIWLCVYLDDEDVYSVRRWDSTNNVWGSSTTIVKIPDEGTSVSYYQKFCFSPKTTSASPPPDNTAPAAITTLSASTYTLTGQIKLEWESPGDDDWSNALDSGSQYKIQYATYNISWDRTNAQITISTSGTNPHTVVSKIITLAQETTYYFRIWTADEVPNWSDISYGATVWVRISPAAITTLSALAEGDGDVKLTWIAPGDDGTVGNLTGKFRIDYATYTKSWNYNTYQIEISTSNLSPLTSNLYTLTGLHGGVTYYFRIWTRDEDTGANSPGNWSLISNASTACVVKVIGISVSTNTYNFGEISVSSQAVSTTTIIVTNTGNITETYSIKGSSAIGGTTPWTLSSSPGHNQYCLYAAFHNVQPSTSSFKTDDLLTYSLQTCTTAQFSIDNTESGKGVLKTEQRNIWFMIKTPTSVSTTAQKTATVTISAEESQ